MIPATLLARYVLPVRLRHRREESSARALSRSVDEDLPFRGPKVDEDHGPPRESMPLLAGELLEQP